MSGFLGRGWSFPVGINATMGIASSQDEDDIREAIEIILSTAKGERVMHPDFGCGIYDYVFETLNTFTSGLIEESIRDALARWEPRIKVENISISLGASDRGKMLISIDYRILATNSEHNLVYPFYVKE